MGVSNKCQCPTHGYDCFCDTIDKSSGLTTLVYVCPLKLISLPKSDLFNTWSVSLSQSVSLFAHFSQGCVFSRLLENNANIRGDNE